MQKQNFQHWDPGRSGSLYSTSSEWRVSTPSRTLQVPNETWPVVAAIVRLGPRSGLRGPAWWWWWPRRLVLQSRLGLCFGVGTCGPWCDLSGSTNYPSTRCFTVRIKRINELRKSIISCTCKLLFVKRFSFNWCWQLMLSIEKSRSYSPIQSNEPTQGQPPE